MMQMEMLEQMIQRAAPTWLAQVARRQQLVQVSPFPGNSLHKANVRSGAGPRGEAEHTVPVRASSIRARGGGAGVAPTDLPPQSSCVLEIFHLLPPPTNSPIINPTLPSTGKKI